MTERVLIIEHDVEAQRSSLSSVLPSGNGFDYERRTWNSFSPEYLRGERAGVVIAVAPPEPAYCLDLLGWLASHPLPVAMLAILPTNPGEQLFHLALQTADDFVFWPVRQEELRCRLSRILGSRDCHSRAPRENRTENPGLRQLVGEDPAFLQVLEKLPAVAITGAPVLLLGETGTGKELCAQALHRLSSRSSGPFVPVECGSIPEHLVENELFGHVKGAFTDAHADQKGLAGMADGGTLFLDEVDTLPPAAQAKLLRFLQESTYRPLGAQKFTRADIRLIAATNCNDLSQRVRSNQFRADLYFRLNVLPLRLPPLRERTKDIPVLAAHFLSLICQSRAALEKKFSASALRALQAHDWPGNVRELFNVTQRAVAFSPGNVILPSHLLLGQPVNEAPNINDHFQKARSRVIGDFERCYIEDMLRKHRGNVTRAALDAGKDRRVFGRLMKKYEIDRHSV